MARRQRARLNRAMCWGAVLICATVAAAYVVSWNRYISYVTFTRTGGAGFFLARGSLAYHTDGGLAWGSMWTFVRAPLEVTPKWSQVLLPGVDRTGGTTICFPVWMLFAGSGLFLVLERKRQNSRLRKDTCPSCQYDLSGLPPGSACPECAAVSNG